MSTTENSKDIQTTTTTTTCKPGKRKLELEDSDHPQCNGNNESINKKEIQDGFSWWTNMMVGMNPKASHVVVNKVCQNKIDISSKLNNDKERQEDDINQP